MPGWRFELNAVRDIGYRGVSGGAASRAAAGRRRMCAECGGLETVVVGRGRRSRARGRRRGAAVKAQGSEVSEGIFPVPAGERSAGSSCQPGRLRYLPERAHSRARGAPHRSKSARRGAEEGGEWGRGPRPPARWHNEGRGARYPCAPPQAGRPGSERQSAGAAGQPQGFAPRKKPHALAGSGFFLGGCAAPLRLCRWNSPRDGDEHHANRGDSPTQR